LPHNVFPRIRVFDSTTIANMIEAATSHRGPSLTYGTHRVNEFFFVILGRFIIKTKYVMMLISVWCHCLMQIRQDASLCYAFCKGNLRAHSGDVAKSTFGDDLKLQQRHRREGSSTPMQHNTSNPTTRPSSSANAQTPCNPIRPDFSAYMRNKYPDQVN
jgi:hypothetical protein